MADGPSPPTMQHAIRHTLLLEAIISLGVIAAMPYNIELLSDFSAPVILDHMYPPFDMGADVADNMNALNDHLGSVEGETVYAVIDLADLKMTLPVAIQGLAAAFLPHADMHTNHVFDSRIQMLVIGSGTVMEIATSSLRQEQYGNRQVQLFDSREDAFDYIRHNSPESA